MPQYVPQPVLSRRSKAAFAGMWIGIVSIVAIVLTWVGTIIALAGIVFSLIGFNETRRDPATGTQRSGRAAAIAGLCCALVGFFGSVALLIYVFNNLEKYGISLTRR